MGEWVLYRNNFDFFGFGDPGYFDSRNATPGKTHPLRLKRRNAKTGKGRVVPDPLTEQRNDFKPSNVDQAPVRNFELGNNR